MWQGLFSLGSKMFYTGWKQKLKMIWYAREALWTSLILNSLGNSIFHSLQSLRALNFIVDRFQTNNTLFLQSSLIQTLILVQSSVLIDRLRVMLHYMQSYLTLSMTKYTATDSNNLIFSCGVFLYREVQSEGSFPARIIYRIWVFSCPCIPL